MQVARFLVRMVDRFARRLLYGLFQEKRWQVSIADCDPRILPEMLSGRNFPEADGWETLEVAKPYTFYADPFFAPQPNALLVEALRAATGLGEIVLLAPEGHRQVSFCDGHMSYPATLQLNGDQFVVPEMAAWSSPKIFSLDDGRLREVGPLRIEGEPRLLDPTLLPRDGKLFLFGSDRAVGSNVLMLWVSEGLDQVFRPHPDSPVRISPQGSRMAGNIVEHEGRTIRLGQDFRSGYGDGIFAFEIEKITPDEYRERPLGSLRFGDRRGPHTVNARDSKIVFDWYYDRFSPLAGVRRFIARRQD